MTYLCQESQFQARIKGYITMCPSQEEYLKIDPASIKNTDGFLGNCKIQLIINKLLQIQLQNSVRNPRTIG